MIQANRGPEHSKCVYKKWVRKFLAGAILALGYSTPSWAQYTWTGAGSSPNNWTDSTNWGGTAPVSSSTTTLTFSGTAGLNSVDNYTSPFQLQTMTFSSGAGAFNISGTPTLQFTSGGGIVQSSATGVTIASPIQTTGTLIISGTGAGLVTLTNTISGSGGLTINRTTGSVNLTLSTAATYTGATTVQTGTLILGASNVLPAASPLVIGSLAGSTGMLFNLNGFNQTVGGITIYAPTASGNTVVSTGAGRLTVNGNIALLDDNAAPGDAWGATFSSSAAGILDLGGAVRNITIAGQANGTSPGDLSLNVVIADGGINFTGNLSSTVFVPTGIQLGGTTANTYALGTTVNAGTLNVASTTTLGTGGLLMNQSGTVASAVVLNSSMTLTSLATGSVSVPGDVSLSLAASGSILTVNQSTSTTFTGIISGLGGLTLTGGGTLNLTNSNTFTGAVTITNGTIGVTSLAAPGSGSGLGAAASTVTFTLGGTGTTGTLAYNGTSAATYARNFLLATGGTGGFAGSGAWTLSGVLSGSGSLVYSGTGSTALTGTNTFTGGIGVTGGLLTFSGASGKANASGNVSISGGGQLTLDNTIAAVQRLNTTTPPSLTLNNGQLTIIGNASSNLSGNTEVFGALNVTGGTSTSNFVTLANSTATTPLQIQFSSLNVSSGAAVLIRGDNLGSSTASNYTRVLFTTAPVSTGTPIPGVYYDQSSTGSGLGQAAYDPTLGIILYSSPTTTGNVLDNIGSPQVPTNASFITGGTGTTLSVNAGATINDLKIQGEFTTIQFSNMYPSQSGNASAPAGTLVITSGLFQDLNTAAAVTITGDTGGSTLQTAGSWTFNLNTNVTFASNMTVTGGGLIMMGAGNLTINGSNNITGNYTLNGGNLTIANSVSASAITVNGTTLLSVGGTTTAASLTLNGTTASAALTGNAVFTGAITSTGTANALTIGGTTSASALTLSGTATATLTGSATIAGGINLSGTGNVLTLSAGGSAASLAGVTGNSLVIGGVLVLNGPSSTEYDGTISGTGSITKTAASTGTLTLTGTNPFSGNLTVNAGTVSTSLGAGVGTGVLTLNGGTLQYTGSSGSLTSSSLSLGSGNGTIAIYTSGTTLTLNNTIGGAGGLTVSGVGTTVTLSLSAQATYAGPTVVSGPVLTLSSSNQLPSATALTIGNVAANDTTSQLSLGSFSQTVASLTIAARGGGAVNSITGTGTLTVNGNISYIDNNVAPGNAYGTTITAGALDLGGAVRTLTVASQNNVGNSDFAIAAIVQDGGLNFIGTLSSTQNTATEASLTGSGANTYSLGTTVNSGTLLVASTTNLGTGGLTINQSGTVASAVILNSSMTISSLATGTIAASASATLTLNTSGSVLTVNQASNTTFAGIISGVGGLTKSGAGTLTLTGVNTYTGATTVAAGTLAIGAGGSLASGSAVTVNGTGTLAGTGTVSGSVTVSSGGTISGGISGTGTLIVGGTTTISANSTIGVTITNGTVASVVPGGSTIGTIPNPTSNNFISFTSSNVTFNAGTLININAASVTFNGNQPYSYEIATVTGLNLSSLDITNPSQFTMTGFASSNFSLTGNSSGAVFLNFMSPVPEPATVLLIGAAGAGLFARVRRRNRGPGLAAKK